MREEWPEPLGDGEDELPVGDGVEQLVLEPVGPDLEALGVTGGAEVARFAAEGDEELGAAALTDDAREAVFEDTAVRNTGAFPQVRMATIGPKRTFDNGLNNDCCILNAYYSPVRTEMPVLRRSRGSKHARDL